VVCFFSDGNYLPKNISSLQKLAWCWNCWVKSIYWRTSLIQLIPPFSSTSADLARTFQALASHEGTFYKRTTPSEWANQERGSQFLRYDLILLHSIKDGVSHNWDGRLWGHRNLAKNQVADIGSPSSRIVKNVCKININEQKSTSQCCASQNSILMKIEINIKDERKNWL